MKALVVGSGGREHALTLKIAQSPLCDRIYCAPGNGGIGQIAQCVPINPMLFEEMANFVESEGIDLTVVGPEAPLIHGIVNHFKKKHLPIFGPTSFCAQLEGSKLYARRFMERHGIPQPQFRGFGKADSAIRYVQDFYNKPHDYDLVVKADGEALGKGVFPCSCVEDAISAIKYLMIEHALGPAGDDIVIEERLIGTEVSLQVLTDGYNIFPLMPAKDRKRAFNGDYGPMTGGMGGNAPIPGLTKEQIDTMIQLAILPAIRGMDKEDHPYKGVLYAGLMITPDGVKVLEYNCRFGDPETQIVLPLLRTDLLEVIHDANEGSLIGHTPIWRPGCSVGVVLASKGYPGNYETGKIITGLEEAVKIEGINIFHAGTALQEGQFVTAGGRVVEVNAVAEDFPTAVRNVYAAVELVQFEGKQYREDIGKTIYS